MTDHQPLRLALTGDSIITRRFAAPPGSPFDQLRQIIREADVAFTNLEVVPNDFQGYPAYESGGSHLGAPSWVIDELVDMGFDLFATATNHSLNYSIAGLLALIDILERKGVAYAGIGRNLAEARMPVYLDSPRGSIAMISCASTFAPGQEASEQRPDMLGRPGLNPLRYETIYDVLPDQLETLRRIAEELGLERQRLERIQLGFAFPPDSPDIFPFLDTNFRAADRVAVHTTPKAKDLDAIATWVREARARADFVLVSLHAHEQGSDREEPAAFIRTFAHRMIDEGADVVVGHGPHLLRGMECYRGKPIFYSLGNFFGQNELTLKIPSDSYERFRIDPSRTPSEMYRIRHDDDRKGFPADSRYWETVVPICHLAEGRVTKIEIVPVSLGHGEPSHRRGRPRLATGAHAEAILKRFAALSEPYGTRIDLDGERAFVRID